MAMDDYDLRLFRAHLPSGWETTVMVTCAPPAGVAPRRSAVFLRQDMAGAADLSAFAARQRNMLAETLREFTLLHDGPTDLGGQVAPLMVFSWEAEGGRLTQVQSFFPAADGAAWIVTLTSASEDYEGLLPEFREIVGAFAPMDGPESGA